MSFYMAQGAIFAKLFSILIQYYRYHFSWLFPGWKMPLQNSQLFPIVGTLLALQSSNATLCATHNDTCLKSSASSQPEGLQNSKSIKSTLAVCN